MGEELEVEARGRASDAVWQVIPGSDLLLQRFGDYGNLHDAHITEVLVNMEDRSVTISMYAYGPSSVNPPTFEGDADVHTFLRMRWLDVKSFEYPLGDNWIWELYFSRDRDWIVTDFSDQEVYLPARIVARSIEVFDVQDPPAIWTTPAGEKIDFVRVRCE